MKKEIINHLIIWILYFIFLTLVNSLYSFSYWPLYVGGIVGLFLSYLDHLLHVFIFNPQELTSQRVLMLTKEKRYKEALILLYSTRDERSNLVFHSINFQLIFAALTFWVVSSSGSLFSRGLVLSYFLSLVLFNFKKFVKNELIFEDVQKTRIYITIQILTLFIFGLLL